jgi:hypothetical protein
MSDNPLEKRCTRCGKVKPITEFWKESKAKDGHKWRCSECCKEINKYYYYLNQKSRVSSTKRWVEKNREKSLIYNREYRANLRKQIIDAYGGKCTCCGECRLPFLTIEHKNGGGRKHRKESKSGDKMYREIINNRFPDIYTILCMNCNFASRGGRICPHEQERQAALAAAGETKS